MAQSHRHVEQVSGILTNKRELEDLIEALHQRGLTEDHVSILMSDKTRHHYYGVKEDTKMPEGASFGGLSGGLLGALIGGLTVAGSVLIPGIGLVVAGPIIGILTGGAVGVAAGGIIGSLVGMGIPEHEAKFFEDALKEEGNVLVVAETPDKEAKEIKALYERYGAEKVKVHH